jgi:triosephosphate isomerase
MGKKLLIVANWKANLVEVPTWLRQFNALSERRTGFGENIQVVIAPPFSMLFLLAASATIAAQDISMFPSGAFTGEVPGRLLRELDVEYCLIGHSERRKYFNENNEIVEKKMAEAIKNGITPILCAQSLAEIPENIRNYPGDKFVIMYEPFSAISVDGVYHPEDPQKVELTLEEWKGKLNLNCKFLYGGSVNGENAKAYIDLPLVSGFVVGHASLDPNDFFSIIKKCTIPQTSV